jgi:hypothetical protein
MAGSFHADLPQAHAERNTADEALDYPEIHSGTSRWHILPAVDHPDEPVVLQTGFGLIW